MPVIATSSDYWKTASAAVLAVACALALTFGVCADARAENGLSWRFAPATPPPASAEEPTSPYPVPLGPVGQISFWSPNHGLLITGGTKPAGPVPAGLYAYNGVEWHELSEVCGGSKGRIAWAGSEEFWTIADQRSGQIRGRQEGNLSAISLCHFDDGKVVHSYALPLGLSDSYVQMDAATCITPNDCWFAGKDGKASNGEPGSFHLHWNGSTVTAIYDVRNDHAVTGMANFEGRLLEGLAIEEKDGYQPSESRTHPWVIREVAPEGQAPACAAGEPPFGPFCDAFPDTGSEPLPIYPPEVKPEALGGFYLATDGGPLGEGASQLWAAADPVAGAQGFGAQVTILRDAHEGTWTQVIPREGTTPLQSGEILFGSQADEGTNQESSIDNTLAPEPGTEAAWLSLRAGSGSEEVAHLARLEANGTLEREEALPNSKLDPVGPRGEAGPIACAAKEDCWMATTKGWLFHLGGQYPRDEDPNFAGVIGYRPPDGATPVLIPEGQTLEEAANQQAAAAPEPPRPPISAPPTPAKAKPLVTHVKSKFVHKRVLVLSFTLTAPAHVQLIGRRKGKVVAHTRKESLQPGRHQLSLTLNPARWPTKLQFQATPVGASAGTVEGAESSESSNSGNTIST